MNVFFWGGGKKCRHHLEGPGVFSCVDSAPFSVYFLGGFSFKDFFGHKCMENLKCIDVFFWTPWWLRDWPQLDGWNTVNMIKSVCTKKNGYTPPKFDVDSHSLSFSGIQSKSKPMGPKPLIYIIYHWLIIPVSIPSSKKKSPPKNAAVSLV